MSANVSFAQNSRFKTRLLNYVSVPQTDAPAPAADDIQIGKSICLQFRP
jgi:hypothetical protein